MRITCNLPILCSMTFSILYLVYGNGLLLNLIIMIMIAKSIVLLMLIGVVALSIILYFADKKTNMTKNQLDQRINGMTRNNAVWSINMIDDFLRVAVLFVTDHYFLNAWAILLPIVSKASMNIIIFILKEWRNGKEKTFEEQMMEM